jgi:myo-inositol-1(or 4)-monophosphatase
MQLIDLAIHAAQKAGLLLCERREQIEISHKGSIDLVTQYDRWSEEIICEILQKSNIAILAEEQGLLRSVNSIQGARWIIDPIDGTTNFSHGIPHYCISIALEIENEIVLGVIYDPNRKELYRAEKNQGAFVNDQRIFVSTCASLQNALMLTGFAYDRQDKGAFYLHYFSHFLQNSRGIRRAGSAALDLAFIACGRGDAYWEFNLKPWDIAAGILLVREAGGFVSGLYPNQKNPLDGHVLAGPKTLQGDLQDIFIALHSQQNPQQSS